MNAKGRIIRAARPEWVAVYLTLVAGMWWFIGTATYAQEPAAPDLPAAPAAAEASADIADNPDVQVQLRGPVHEAFAERVAVDPVQGIVVKQKPPAAIEEIPPDVKPAGNNVIWIPGYWGWDDETNDFLWVSGVWRVAPDGMRWVPGYWADASGGFQWVSGFWAPAETEEIAYAPQPPQSLEQGPNQPAPGDNYFWVPGCYQYTSANWAWQPGYWSPYQPGFIWMPSRWCWTPRGYVFCRGYWDRPWSGRGTLFAPLWLSAGLRARGGFRYTPASVIASNVLGLHLFVNGNYPNYYFGNYYGSRLGYRPWFQVATFRGAYDPVFGYNNWYFRRQGIDYRGRLSGWHTIFAENRDSRPAVTLRDQRTWLQQHSDDQDIVKVAAVAKPLTEIAGRVDGKTFVRLDANQRKAMAEVGQQLRLTSANRAKVEVTGRGTTRVDGTRIDGRVDGRAAARFKLPEVAHVPGVLDRPTRILEKPTEGRINRVLPVPKGGPRVDTDVDGRVERDPDGPRVNPKPKIEPRIPVEPKVNPPRVEPKVIPPRVEPQVNPPKVNLPRVNPPKVNPPKIKPPNVVPRREAPRVQPRTNPPRVEPRRSGGGNRGGGNHGGRGGRG